MLEIIFISLGLALPFLLCGALVLASMLIYKGLQNDNEG